MEEYFALIFDPENVYYQVVVALFLGIFIGLRRQAQVDDQKVHGTDMMGVRTTSLFVLLGTLTTIFADEYPVLLPIMLVGLLSFVLAAYVNGAFRLQRYGLTSEISAILLFFIGMLIGRGQMILAILLAVMLGVSSAYKSHIHAFSEKFSLKEWSGALQLLVITALVLPLLPKEAVDPWGVFVPWSVWLLVIFISGIGFLGYFFTKYAGERASVLVVTFLGSLVSSTATTIALAERSKKTAYNTQLLTVGILMSIAVMQLRVVVEVLLLSQGASGALFASAAAMFVASAVLAGLLWLRLRSDAEQDTLKARDLRSPFELLPALKFALFFTCVLFAIHFGTVYFGALGAYIAALIVAFADVDAVVFSALLMWQGGEQALLATANVIAIAAVVNTAVKLLYIFVFGARGFFFQVMPYVGAVVLVGVVSAVGVSVML